MNDRSPPTSPTSPMSHRKQSIPSGFRPAPRPKQRLEEMTLRELQDLHSLNAKILSSPGASTSTYVDRVMTQQAQVEGRLIELEGMETINVVLKKTRIKGEGDMNVNNTFSEPPVSRTIEAKRKALHKFAPAYGVSVPGALSLQEAMNLEQQAHMREKERLERIAEKKRRLGMPIEGEVLTRKEREARMWAFMNQKPTDSDMEDDDDESDEDDDPASWFEDDQDDGRKGQDIIEPDVEDLSDIIRIDESRIHCSTFYQPRDDGD